MKNYLYLLLTPESLVASHLPPADFGNYLAVGTRKRLRGQAIFLELNPAFMKQLPVDYMSERLVPYDDGEPKRSLYLSIYRVLENTPLEAMKNLYLVTDDGKVLELKSGPYKTETLDILHLYQQFNPICTRVASKLTPPRFIGFLTDTKKAVSAPAIFMAELKLNKLARHPEAPLQDLPYPNPDHLRDCLTTLMLSDKRQTKTVIRQFKGELSYRTIKTGFFVGKQESYLYYAFPSAEELESTHYSWWRSALTQCF
jgi:hypothetical protein